MRWKEKLNKIDSCFYQIVLIVERKNQLSLKNQELLNDQFNMNKTINKFLLTGYKFVPKLHLKQPGFTYSACGTFTKHRERIQKLKKKVI